MLKCKSCGARVLYVMTSSGRKCPVNPELVYIDTSEVEKDTKIITTRGNVVHGKLTDKTSGQYIIPGFIAHNATCNNPDNRRKRGKQVDKNTF